MTTGQKIYECRRSAGMTQEELADRLGITRQAVSRWEQDLAFPETKQLIELCKLFQISSDELLFGKEGEHNEAFDDGKGKTWGVIDHGKSLRFEYISKRRLWGLPLLHINFGLGCRAHGIFAIGLLAVGFCSAGILSVGFLSFGVLAIGLLVFGSIVLGGAAFGAVALGLFALGGLAVGIMSFGGLAVGQVAIGGFAVGQYAVGDVSRGWLAVGMTRASGMHTFLIPDGLDALHAFLTENVAPGLSKFIEGIARILHN